MRVIPKKIPLVTEITSMLVLKLIILTLIWYACYREPVIPSMIDGMPPEKVTAAILERPVTTDLPVVKAPE